MPNQPKRLIVRLLEVAAMFALAAFLIRLGVCYLLAVRIPLIALGILSLLVVIGYRVWKYRSGL
jgi:hypothetical protein